MPQKWTNATATHVNMVANVLIKKTVIIANANLLRKIFVGLVKTV